MSFTVYSDPVKLRYGEVHNRMQKGTEHKGLPLPPEVVARYASGDKLMAISGFDPEMVRRHADGSESLVKLSDHYLHHYILNFGEADTMRSLFDFEENSEEGHLVSGCHGMTGAGVHAFQEHLKAKGGDQNGERVITFGSAAGAEYRHNPQRFETPYRLVVSKPEVWAPTLHIINTNLTDNRTQALPGVSRLLECPCTPQRKIDVAAGTIDGKPANPPIHCSKQFDATGNPSCHLSTYVGGWRCCEHGMFLIDTDKECKTPACSEKFVDEVYMKYTFYYEDAEPTTRNVEAAACCDVTGSGQGVSNIEHDVVPCAQGTPPEQCVFIAESVQPLGYYGKWPWSKPKGSDLVDLFFAAPHLHWAGNSLELIDDETNETICEVHRTPDNSGGIMYGTGAEAGNENGYMTGLSPCTWGGRKAPRFRRDHKLRTRAVYDATTYHTGVMSLWLMEVSAVEESVVV
jgi:hypothetical protein